MFPEIYRSQELLQNNSEDLFFMRNQAMANSHNFENLPMMQGSPVMGLHALNPMLKGKIFKGSVAAKNKSFSDTYKVNELIVINFSHLLYLLTIDHNIKFISITNKI